MRISVLLGSSRPGGLDISLAGLAAQDFGDFEVIFSDYRYHKRRYQVRYAVARSGLRQAFLHVPHHRYRDDEMGTVAAGFNTAFALARGERVVMLMDYAFCPPGWLAAHAESDGIAIGPIETREIRGAVTKDGTAARSLTGSDKPPFEQALADIIVARESYDEVGLFTEPFTADRLDEFPLHPNQDWRLSKDEPCEPWAFCTKNESFPREAVLEVNGMSEDCDRASLRGDEDLALRLARVCGQPRLVSAAKVVCLDPHPYLPKPANALSSTEVSRPLPTYYPIHHERSVGWFEWARKRARADNPIELRTLSEQLESWRTAVNLPRRVILDTEYYREPLPYAETPNAAPSAAPQRKRVWVGRWAWA